MLKSLDIEHRLINTLQEFIADWGLEADIDRDTYLVGSLEFDSIDVIQFIVAVETSFGKRSLGFQSLLMRDGRYVDDLSVGEIVDFVESRLVMS